MKTLYMGLLAFTLFSSEVAGAIWLLDQIGFVQVLTLKKVDDEGCRITKTVYLNTTVGTYKDCSR